MYRRIVTLVAVLFLLINVSGCSLISDLLRMSEKTAGATVEPTAVATQPPPSPTQPQPSPTAAAAVPATVAATVALQPPTTIAPTRPTAAAPASPTLTRGPSPTLAPATVTSTPTTGAPPGLKAPALVGPADQAGDSVLDLAWKWDGVLGPDDWFEVQLWPDVTDATPTPTPRVTPYTPPGVYAWLKETTLRITDANLLPGAYRWQVCVVRGRGQSRRQFLSPCSEVWSFVLRRSTGATITPTLTLTGTIVPTWTPRPTWTLRPRLPLPLPIRTPTRVLPPYPVPTRTSVPEPTSVAPPPYPVPTNTSRPPTVPPPPPTVPTVPRPTTAPTVPPPAPTVPPTRYPVG